MSKGDENFFIVLLVVCCLSALSFLFGRISGRGYMRDTAVSEQHAEYYLDKDNEKQWRWIDHSEEKTDE